MTLVIHHFFRVLVALLQRVGVMKLELSGVDVKRREDHSGGW